MRQYAIGLGFVALTGCSFALVSGPPANHQQLPVVECTTSRLGPILDMIWTGLQASNLVLAVATTNAKWDEQFAPEEAPFSRKTGIAMYSGFAALGAAGLYYGWTRTGACREAKAELIVRGSQGQAPQPGGVPQPGTWPPAPGTPPGATQPAGTGPGTWPPPPPISPAPGPAPAGTPPTP